MSTLLTCPGVERLEQVVHGNLSLAEEEILERHLLDCNACIESARMLETPNEGRPSPVVLPESYTPSQTYVNDLVQHLLGLRASMGIAAEAGGAAPYPSEQTNLIHDFLAPARGPDELGWLGSYRILKVLGAGGMGTVFLAEDAQLHRRVALKVIQSPKTADRTAGPRFLREARAAAAVKHDHVVTIYQVAEERGVLFLAMELLEGESLHQRLKREVRLPIPEVLRIGREVAAGLHAAHQCGLIHRDIKPANLWLEAESARVKILDFGLARVAQGETMLTEVGAIVGTAAFMAPEQARGEAIAGSDLFSLGCVLYQMCTGALPFPGKDTYSTLMAVATTQPPPPHEVNPAVPGALSNLVLQLLSKEPGPRPASARAVEETLRGIEKNCNLPGAASGSPASSSRKAVERATARNGDRGLGHRFQSLRNRPRRVWAVVAALLLLVAVPVAISSAPTVLQFVNNQGTLIVEVDDPNVEIKVRQNSVTVTDLTTKGEFVLSAGKSEIEVEVVEKNGIRLVMKKFSITRGGKEIVSVRRAEVAPDLPLHFDMPSANDITLLDENFGDKVPGNLAGQGAWRGDFIPVEKGRINLQLLPPPDGFTKSKRHWVAHRFRLPESVDRITLTAEVLAYSLTTSDHYRSENSGFDLLFAKSHEGVSWSPGNKGTWIFDARKGHHPVLPENQQKLQRIQGGFDDWVKLMIVMDAKTEKVFGMYDFGKGWEKTNQYDMARGEIGSLDTFRIHADYRTLDSFRGFMVRNVRIWATPGLAKQ